MLTSEEMKRMKGILENPHIIEWLEGIFDIAQRETHPLLN